MFERDAQVEELASKTNKCNNCYVAVCGLELDLSSQKSIHIYNVASNYEQSCGKYAFLRYET